jgi:hypothetical protein
MPTSGPLFEGDGGADIRLAVLAPEGQGLATDEAYLPVYVQGLLNNNFGKASAMTLIDRQYLDKIIAEQDIAANGRYSDDDFISIGNLTNVQYILAGTIQKLPNNEFALQLAITDLKTGVRKAVFMRNASAAQLDALINEATEDLLSQMGVRLTAAGQQQLAIKRSSSPAPRTLKQPAPVPVPAAPVVQPKQPEGVRGTPGLYYQVETGGTVTITGYTGTAAIVAIPDTIEGKPVTSIYGNIFRGGAFRGCTRLTSVTLPAGLTSIGDLAFSGCTRLTSVTLPAGLTSIGISAFSYCTRLTSVTLPAGLTSIDSSAFSGCTGLTFTTNGGAWTTAASGKILIKDGNTVVAYPGASGAVNLSSLTGLTSIGRSAFDRCTRLTSVTLPAGLTTIDSWAFFGCTRLTSVTLSAGLTSIGISAFSGCTRLKTVVFWGSGVTIDRHSFPFDPGINAENGVYSVGAPHRASGVSLKAAYEAGATGGNTGVAGTYKRDATGDNAGSWSRQ